jgi:hypothetical protein
VFKARHFKTEGLASAAGTKFQRCEFHLSRQPRRLNGKVTSFGSPTQRLDRLPKFISD